MDVWIEGKIIFFERLFSGIPSTQEKMKHYKNGRLRFMSSVLSFFLSLEEKLDVSLVHHIGETFISRDSLKSKRRINLGLGINLNFLIRWDVNH